MKFFKILSGLGIISIFAGAIHKFFYYRAFNIDILHYMSFSETLIFFDEFVPIMFLILLFGAGLALIVNTNASELNNQNVTIEKTFVPYIKGVGFWARFKEHCIINKKWFSILLIFSIPLLPFMFLKPIQPRAFEMVFIFFSYPVITIVLNYFIYEVMDRVTRRLKVIQEKIIDIELIVFAIDMTIPVFIIYIMISIELVKSNPGKKLEIEFNSKEKFNTTNDIKYIGKTEQYIFFHNIKDSTSTIFKMDDIKIINIKN